MVNDAKRADVKMGYFPAPGVAILLQIMTFTYLQIYLEAPALSLS